MRKWLSGIVGVAALLVLTAANPLNNPSVSSSGSDADGTAFAVESVPGTACTATGTDAVCIGDNAEAGDAANDNGVLAIGMNAVATGANSICIGQNCDATGLGSIAIGGSITDASSADATNTNAVALGPNSSATNVDTLALGSSAVGSGNSATAIGPIAIASGDRSIAIGRNTDATGDNCIAIGGNVTDTDSADCSAASSISMGQHVIADDVGSFAFAEVEFSARDTKRTIYHLVIQTTDDTQTELSTDNGAAGADNDISIASDCGVTVDVLIHARQTNADGQSAGYRILAVLDNNADTTALVGSASTTTIGEDVAGWDVTITADDTNDGVNVLVTGATSDNINWSAFAEVILSCG